MKLTAKLLKQWNRKLEASGFVDIECSHGRLKEYDDFWFRCNYSPESFEEKRRYYELAGQLLYNHEFKSAKHKRIWELHCDGESPTEISKRYRCTPGNISHILRYYRTFFVGI